MRSVRGGAGVAVAAARATLRDPLAVLTLFAIHLLSLAGLWAILAWSFGEALSGRPALDLFQTLALGFSCPAGTRRALIGLGVLLGLQLPGSALIATLLLGRLRGDPALPPAPSRVPGARLLLRLLLLRLVTLGMAASLIAGAVVSLPWVYRVSLAIADERWQAALLVAAGLPILIGLLATLLIFHFGQPLLAEGRPLGAALAAALELVHRRPLALASLYLGGWLLWSGLTLLGWLGLLLPLLAGLMRVVVQVWSYAAALRAITVWRAPASS